RNLRLPTVFEQVFQVCSQRDGFILPPRYPDERADSESAKPGLVAALNTFEPIIKIAFWPGAMHLCVHTAIVAFPRDNAPFSASIDNWRVTLAIQSADLNGNR